MRGRPVNPVFIFRSDAFNDKTESVVFTDPLSDIRCMANTTLSGGSLGSCVDEERSQLRELM